MIIFLKKKRKKSENNIMYLVIFGNDTWHSRMERERKVANDIEMGLEKRSSTYEWRDVGCHHPNMQMGISWLICYNTNKSHTNWGPISLHYYCFKNSPSWLMGQPTFTIFSESPFLCYIASMANSPSSPRYKTKIKILNFLVQEFNPIIWSNPEIPE